MCKPKKPKIVVPEPKKDTPNFLKDQFLDRIFQQNINSLRASLGTSALRADIGGAAPTAGLQRRPSAANATPNFGAVPLNLGLGSLNSGGGLGP